MPRRRVVASVLAHAGAIVVLCLAFSLALAPGLLVKPLYGSIGLILTAVLAAACVCFGFIRKRN